MITTGNATLIDTNDQVIISYHQSNRDFGYFLLFAGIFSFLASLAIIVVSALHLRGDQPLADVLQKSTWMNFSWQLFLVQFFMSLILSLIIFTGCVLLLIKIYERKYGFVFVDKIQSLLSSITLVTLFITSYHESATLWVQIILFVDCVVYVTHSYSLLRRNVQTVVTKMDDKVMVDIAVYYPLISWIKDLNFRFVQPVDKKLSYTILNRNIRIGKKNSFTPDFFMPITADEYQIIIEGRLIFRTLSFMLIRNDEGTKRNNGTLLTTTRGLEETLQVIDFLESHNFEFVSLNK